jgi:hypothetical protein
MKADSNRSGSGECREPSGLKQQAFYCILLKNEIGMVKWGQWMGGIERLSNEHKFDVEAMDSHCAFLMS